MTIKKIKTRLMLKLKVDRIAATMLRRNSSHCDILWVDLGEPPYDITIKGKNIDMIFECIEDIEVGRCPESNGERVDITKYLE